MSTAEAEAAISRAEALLALAAAPFFVALVIGIAIALWWTFHIERQPRRLTSEERFVERRRR